MSAPSGPGRTRRPRRLFSASVLLGSFAAVLLWALLPRLSSAGPLLGPASAPHANRGVVILPSDRDPENLLYNCGTRRVPFGDRSIDVPRCLTFRYQVPRGGIARASLHLAIDPLGSLQDTDALAVAVAAPNPDCGWGAGQMAGCVTVHGGFRGDETAIDLDLMDLDCNPSVKVSPEAQKLVRDQLQTGVLHMVLQDDTAVLSAQLVLNGDPVRFPCGAAVREDAGKVPLGPTSGAPGTAFGRLVTGSDAPRPPDPLSTAKAAVAGLVSLGLFGLLNALLSGSVADAAAAVMGEATKALGTQAAQQAAASATPTRLSARQDKLIQTALDKSKDALTGMVEPKDEKVWKCPSCTYANREKDRFCTNCGTRRVEGQ